MNVTYETAPNWRCDCAESANIVPARFLQCWPCGATYSAARRIVPAPVSMTPEQLHEANCAERGVCVNCESPLSGAVCIQRGCFMVDTNRAKLVDLIASAHFDTMRAHGRGNLLPRHEHDARMRAWVEIVADYVVDDLHDSAMIMLGAFAAIVQRDSVTA